MNRADLPPLQAPGQKEKYPQLVTKVFRLLGHQRPCRISDIKGFSSLGIHLEITSWWVQSLGLARSLFEACINDEVAHFASYEQRPALRV